MAAEERVGTMRHAVLFVYLGWAALSVEARAEVVDFRTIDVPQVEPHDTIAAAISGGVVVGTTVVLGGRMHGFIYDASGGITKFDGPGSTEISPQGFDGSNIVGWGVGPLGVFGFLRDDLGSFTTLAVPGSNGTWAYGISHGSITGTYEDASGSIRSFLRGPSGDYSTIDMPGRFATSAFGIDSGQIVGVVADTAAGPWHGFLRDASGSFSLIDVPGAVYTEARGIGQGRIVGTYFDGITERGFVRDSSGRFTVFDFPGAARTVALDIDHDWIVGYYSDSEGRARGFQARFAAVPEPSTLGIGALGAVCLLAARKKPRAASAA